ncbi:MAG: hypothetical protein ACWGHH_03900 [Sulfurovaceae bacterium]
MRQSLEVKDICEAIWDIEQEFGLLDITINDLKMWQLIRMHIFLKIAIKKGVYSQPHTTKYGIKDKLKGLPSRIKSSLFYNPFLSRKNVDILILDHPKKQKVDDEYIDVYTKYFIDDLQKNGADFEVIEMPHMHEHVSKDEQFRRHTDAMNLLMSLIRPFIKVRLNNEVKTLLQNATTKIKTQLNIEIDLISECMLFAKRFSAQRIFIKKLLKKKSPKQMYVVVGYAYANWIQVAKELGIETIEFQHGVISRYNIGYSFPYSKKGTVDTFADKLYIWKDFWREMSVYPINNNAIIMYPFHFAMLEQEKYREIKKNEKEITIISQGTITEELAKMILKNINNLEGYTLNYKLHPGEFDRWEICTPLVEVSKYPNVTMIKNEIPLYNLFAASKYVIGVYSAALFEAMDFGCEILLADLPGIEHMEVMIERELMYKIKDNSIVQALNNTQKNMKVASI